MTESFSDYVASVDSRKQIEDNVLKYTLMLCDALRDNASDGYDYVIETGRKYHKIVMIISGGDRSCHAFVDKKTGEVYKSASWKSPAKGVRYDLRIIEEREWLLKNADWAGRYLYRN